MCGRRIESGEDGYNYTSQRPHPEEHKHLTSRYFGLIAAAGTGERFAAGANAQEGTREAFLPKQYRSIGELPMLLHAANSLLAAAEIEIVFIVLSALDEQFRMLDRSAFGNRIEPLYCGGASRRDSVLNGLVAASDVIDADDWVLVHDAARPCLGADELRRLLSIGVEEHSDGGILAIPVADTLKRGNAAERISATESREGLWQAQTPQMFRHGLLLRALHEATQVTDEASAVEMLGLHPRLVRGSSMNIKVTVAGDLALAGLILGSRAERKS